MRIVKEIFVTTSDSSNTRKETYRVIADFEFEPVSLGTGDPAGIDVGRAVDAALDALRDSLKDHAMMP